ncbi:hypothetical protein CEXT_114791 [Caerostris extrusa]|uniref:Uncharacterized protein n=1 Tax=Caerostris extrusa TaxID=172846 RepID=A0AAV4X6S9_CAEEX|nr:hypothetical protein CEXT_114791 [Caerostris extrusa]
MEHVSPYTRKPMGCNVLFSLGFLTHSLVPRDSNEAYFPCIVQDFLVCISQKLWPTFINFERVFCSNTVYATFSEQLCLLGFQEDF